MSSLWKPPSKAKTPPLPEQVEHIVDSEKDMEDVRKRTARSMMSKGRSSTILSGIQTQLKKRMGE